MSMMAIRPSLETYALARLLGARRPHRFSRPVALKVKKLRTRLEPLMIPRLYYQTKKIDSINKETVNIRGGKVFRSQKLSKAMKDCEKIICFIATIGSDIEKEIAQLIVENRISDAYILDSMGSVAVENMAEKFHQRITARFESENKGITLRFSPGYCDWPITDQRNLFKLFDSYAIGIELLDSCLMRPRKSISGVFGIYDDIRKAPCNPCLDCSKKACNARRV